MELIKEILEDKNGSYGIVTVGRFATAAERDSAWDRYFLANNRKGIRMSEE
jgi:hypothetical protein